MPKKSTGKIRDVLPLTNFVEALIGGLITTVVVTPILLSHAIINGRDIKASLGIGLAALIISGIFSWRIGVALGSGSAIVITFATIYLSSSSSEYALLDFVLIILATASITLWRAGLVLKSVAVLLIAIIVATVHGALQPALVIMVVAIAALCLNATIDHVGSETVQVFDSLRGNWGPVFAYLAVSTGAVVVFALWYLAAFLYWPDTAFDGVENTDQILRAGAIKSFPTFLYQSILIFATEGPPYPPKNKFTRLLVGLEAACSVLLIGLYLSLLVNSLSRRKERSDNEV